MDTWAREALHWHLGQTIIVLWCFSASLQAVESQIRSFGQTPCQLLIEPHSPRSSAMQVVSTHARAHSHTRSHTLRLDFISTLSFIILSVFLLKLPYCFAVYLPLHILLIIIMINMSRSLIISVHHTFFLTNHPLDFLLSFWFWTNPLCHQRSCDSPQSGVWVVLSILSMYLEQTNGFNWDKIHAFWEKQQKRN